MVYSAYRIFVGSFISKYVFNLLLNLKRILKSKSKDKIKKYLVTKQINWDAFRFSAVLGLINFTYKFLLCNLRKHTSYSDKQIAPFAGFIAAFWLLLDPNKSRRNLISILMLSRATDIILN